MTPVRKQPVPIAEEGRAIAFGTGAFVLRIEPFGLAASRFNHTIAGELP